MKTLKYSLALLALLMAACSPTPTVMELPRPNSGAFSFEQAESRKSEIYGLSPSEAKPDWENPYVGFCIHITDNGELLVYNNFSNMAASGEIEEHANRLQRASQLRPVVRDHLGLIWGNPVGVLITSSGGGESAILPDVVDMLFRPSIQIYYLGTP